MTHTEYHELERATMELTEEEYAEEIDAAEWVLAER